MSTTEVCGDFVESQTPDLGQCAALRVVKTCEVATVPAQSTILYNPDELPVFTID